MAAVSEYCQPGFLTDIEIVSKKIQNGRNLFSLVFDSMAIRKRLVVEKSNNMVLGHVTIGDTSKMASEVLVFLLVPILGGSRYPIGYFYIDKIDSDLQSQLILQCLKLTAECNIHVVNITCDCCVANISTFKKLGAEIPHKPFFKHPAMDGNVYTTMDPVHMLKLARNALGTIRKLKAFSCATG